MMMSTILLGTAIYVYGILVQSSVAPNGMADVTFFIDDQIAGNFKYTPPGINASFLYNQLLWQSGSLSSSRHTFSLQNGRSGDLVSLLLFDYVVYTT